MECDHMDSASLFTTDLDVSYQDAMMYCSLHGSDELENIEQTNCLMVIKLAKSALYLSATPEDEENAELAAEQKVNRIAEEQYNVSQFHSSSCNKHRQSKSIPKLGELLYNSYVHRKRRNERLESNPERSLTPDYKRENILIRSVTNSEQSRLKMQYLDSNSDEDNTYLLD